MGCFRARITAVLELALQEAQGLSVVTIPRRCLRLLVAVRLEIESLRGPLSGRGYGLW